MLLNQFGALLADGKRRELLLKQAHVERPAPNLVEVVLEVLGKQKHYVPRADIEGTEVVVIEVGVRKDNGEKLCRRLIDLVALLEQVEAELVSGKQPLPERNEGYRNTNNQRRDRGKKRWVYAERAHADTKIKRLAPSLG